MLLNENNGALINVIQSQSGVTRVQNKNCQKSCRKILASGIMLRRTGCKLPQLIKAKSLALAERRNWGLRRLASSGACISHVIDRQQP
jgi:hypothetical protein